MNNAQEIRSLIIFKLNEMNISPNKMLAELELNLSYITDMQRRNRMPTADKLGIIAEYLDVSVDYLLGRTDKPEVNK